MHNDPQIKISVRAKNRPIAQISNSIEINIDIAENTVLMQFFLYPFIDHIGINMKQVIKVSIIKG